MSADATSSNLAAPMTEREEEALDMLEPLERFGFELADFVTTRIPGVAAAWNTAFMGFMLWGAGGRRLDVRGLENVPYGKRDRILLVANHRSFFDFFVITAVMFWRTNFSKRILFPVRSTFFYDHPLGPLMNATMSGMAMFPPILRDKKRKAFNRYSIQRCVEELAKPGTVMGLHPEGTRNKSEDPYSYLPAQTGVGRVALETTAHVHPVFVHGLTNNLAREWRRNWLMPKSRHPITVMFGPEVDFADLKAAGSSTTTQKKAADRCLDAIAQLGEAHRRGG
ncbi:MAG: lysophospholipid acyltransferase family protein [Polyangiales bacterium]